MSITIRPYKVEDGIELQKKAKEANLKVLDNFEEWAKSNAFGGPGYTVVADGQIIGAAGVKIFWDGVGEGWGIFIDGADKWRTSILRYTKEYFELIKKAYQLRFVQAHIRSDMPGAINFVQHLGFERKCTLEKFFWDEMDCYLYVWTG